MDSLKSTCSSILSSRPSDIANALSRFKAVMSHYVNDTMYDEAACRYILDEFVQAASAKLLITAQVALVDQALARDKKESVIFSELTLCCKLLLDIAVPLIAEGHPMAAHLIMLCLMTPPGQLRRKNIAVHLCVAHRA